MSGTRPSAGKSAWLAYRIVANGCWIVSLAALVVYGIRRIPAALAVTITLDAVTIGAFCRPCWGLRSTMKNGCEAAGPLEKENVWIEAKI